MRDREVADLLRQVDRKLDEAQAYDKASLAAQEKRREALANAKEGLRFALQLLAADRRAA